MPGPSGKKRLSSRRRVIKHNETPEDLTVSDPSPAAQPEEKTDLTPLETHYLLSSEQKGNRRKLDSNQQSQRKYEVEQSSRATHHKPTEEVEQNVSREQHQTTPMIQTEEAIQIGFNKTDEYAAHLYAASTVDDVERPQPITETLHVDHHVQESGSLVNAEPYKPLEETGTTAEVVWCSAHSTVEKQLIHHAKVTAMPVHISPVTDSEKENTNEETDLLTLIEHSTEGMTFSTGTEIAPDKRYYDEIRNHNEQADYPLTVEELPVNAEQHEHFDISRVRVAQHPDIVIDYVKSLESDHVEVSQILIHDHKEDTLKKMEDQIMNQSELTVQIPKNKQEVQPSKEDMEVLDQEDENDHICSTNMELLIHVDNTEHRQPQENDHDAHMVCDEEQSPERVVSGIEKRELSSQSEQPQKSFVVDSQGEHNNMSADVPTESFSPARSRRKLGSSRRNKRSPVKDFDPFSELKDTVSAEETRDDTNHPDLSRKTTELVSEETLPIEIDTLGTIEGEDMRDLVWKTNRHPNSAQLLSDRSNSTETPVELDFEPNVEPKPKAVEENATPKTQNRNVEDGYFLSQPPLDALVSSPTPEMTSLNDDANTEDHGPPKAETSTTEVQHGEVLIKEFGSLEINQKEDSEMWMHEHEEDIEHQVEEIRETEKTKCHDSSLNPPVKQDEDTMKEDKMEDLDQRDEKEVLININTEDTPPQEHHMEAQMVSDVEQSPERVEESEVSSQSVQPDQSSVFHSQNEDNNASADVPTESFSPAGIRRKLGSSRRNKGSRVKDFDPFSELKDTVSAEETKDDTNHPDLSRKTTELVSKETLTIEIDTLGTIEGEDMSDLVWKTNRHPNSAQLLSDRSNSTETPVELDFEPNVEPKPKAVEENASPLTQSRNVEDGYFLSQPPLDALVSSPTPEMTSLNDDANTEDHGPPKAETSTAEVQHGEVLIKEFGSLEINQKEDSEMWMHEHEEDIERQVEEIRETEKTKCHDSSLNPLVKQEEDTMKEDKMEDLDQRDEKDVLININTEDTPPQEHHMEAQMVSDVEQSPEKIEESEVSSQSVQPDKSSVFHSQNEDNNASADVPTESFSPARSRRKLGSSRRNKGSRVHKVSAADTYIELKKEAEDDNNDPAETATLTLANTVRSNTICTADAHTEDSVAKATTASRKEEMSPKVEHCFSSSDASVECTEVKTEGNLTVATETAGQQASLQQSDPHFKPTQQVEMKVAVEDDEDKDDLRSEAEDLDQRTDSTSYVQEAEEPFSDQNLEDVSLQKESLATKVMHVLNADQEEIEQLQRESEEKPNPTPAPEAFALKLNYPMEPAVDACDTSVSDACQNQQEIHENQLNFQVKTSTKKRKLGSTRMRQINRKQEPQMDSLCGEIDMGGLENVGVLEGVPQKEALEDQRAASSCEMNKAEEYQELHSSTGESHMISAADVMPVLPEQSFSCRAEGSNPFTSQADDLSGNEKCIDAFEPNHVLGSDVYMITSVDTELHLNTRTTPSGTLGKDSTESPAEDQINPQELKTESGEAPDKNTETRSPNLSLTHKKRKMGSTRRNLGTISKVDLEQNLDVNNAHVHDVLTEPASPGEDIKLKPHSGYKDSEAINKNVVLSHSGDLQNTTSEHNLSPRDDLKETSPKLDVLSEVTLGGRRRKLGSHRKTRGGHQSQGDDLMMKDQPPAKTATTADDDDIVQNRKESENRETDTKPSSIIISSMSARSLTSQEMTHHDGVLLGHDSQKNISSVKPYNVVMVGDSSVGKTSFMRRAQNGKFLPDMPASVGLDTCLWTVVVEGKPVVLQLWDTAGQERFHSVTKQIFHRAHAFLLMYDITSSQSFTAVSYWASCIQEGAVDKNIPILLLGNKSDHAGRRVKTEEGQNFAKTFNSEFIECSAVTGDNVIQSLEAVARLLSHRDAGREETLVLHKEPPKKTTRCC
uniref:uncharacterized protein rab44 n=1 Tax=Doryrhamphus excisus TaxID=161450 RepID=UPI0025ADA040|nr:uncharacterized protein rab44 [Doryrhamphus excisus]